MFAGIIDEVGKILSIQRRGEAVRFKISAEKIVDGLELGASISVNGACLTVVNFGEKFFEVDAVEETIRRTNLGELNVSSFVNLERARKFSDRIDGHIVQGHIDTIGKINRIVPVGISRMFFVSFPNDFRQYLVPKGSIAIDGISLTVVDVQQNIFSVSVIPFTFERTNLKYKKVGESVNLEFDIISKYVVNYLSLNNKQENKSIFDEFYNQK
jgi:riboflavin synthase